MSPEAEKLYRIDDPTLWQAVKTGLGEMQAGTYTLIGLAGDGKPQPIARFLGTDPNGILYYGTSEHVANRVGQLRQAICAVYKAEGYSSGGHMAGWKLDISPAIKELFPSHDRFRLRVRPCQEFKTTGEPHWSAHETYMLREYRSVYGEYPPLNG